MRRAVSNAVFEIEWLVQPEPVDSCTLRASNARARASTTKVPDIVLHIRLIWPRWSLQVASYGQVELMNIQLPWAP